MERTATPPQSTARHSKPRIEATSNEFALGWLRHQFLAIDLLIIGFLAALILWTLLGTVAPDARIYAYDARYEWAEMPGWELSARLALILGVYLVAQRLGIQYHRNYLARGLVAPKWLRLGNLVYVFIPVPLLPFVFNLLGAFIAGVSGVPTIATHAAYDPAVLYDPAATYWDLWLKNADISIFGVYPALWLRQYHSPPTVGLMIVCYLAYYVSPLVAVLPQVVKRDWRRVRRAAAVYAGALLLTYVGYIIIPATGPRFEGTFTAWAADSGWFAATWWQGVLDKAEIIRWDAFPSGHVTIAIVSLVLALRYHRKIGLAYLPFVLGLMVATVFLGYHYVTDVVVGVILAGGTFLVIEPIVRWWESIWKLPKINKRA